MNLNKIQAGLLRGGFCAVWLFGFLLGFFEFLYSVIVDMGSPENTIFMVRAMICIGVGIVAAIAHAYLLGQARDDKGAHVE